VSRTIRRKNSHLKSWAVDPVEKIDQWDMKRYGAHTPEQCVIRQAAHFHSDGYSGWCQGSPPHFFRRFLNKRVDRANKAEIFRCVASNCWDDFQAHPYLANAGWYWW
jgi:hypothetical protein